jgi:glycosyltransferase involved in cell wall biosynthesis
VSPILSIAIPSYKRATLLALTLDAFLPQVAKHSIPICISFTDDTDATTRVIEEFSSRYPYVTAVMDPEAINIDRKMVSAVALARSRYVWLFGDDDIPESGAVDRVMELLGEKDWGVLVLNASSYHADFSYRVEERRMRIWEDRVYAPGEHEAFLADTASYTTFLGGLVFERSLWESVEHTDYFDTDYLHVAVIYRAIVGKSALVVAAPQLRLRLGSATWADRYFVVELVNWPRTVWGLPFKYYSDASKAQVCDERPTASLARLLSTRAYGFYGLAQFRQFIETDPEISRWKKLVLLMPLLLPISWAGYALVLYRRIKKKWCNANVELTLYRLRQGRR